MATAVEDLYRRDFYAWTRDQARRLRELDEARSNVPLDLGNLAEEVEGLGLSDLRGAKSHARRIIAHLLKLEHSPSAEPRAGWQATIVEARTAISDVLSRALRNDLEAEFASLYPPARKVAVLGLPGHGEGEAARSLPAECPYTLDDILRDDWCPPSRHGIVDAE